MKLLPVVLVVDRDPETVEALRQRLPQDRCEVLAVQSAKDSFDLARARRPVLTFISLEIPNGIALCNRMKGHPQTRSIPVVLMARHWDPRILKLHSTLETRADNYISVPFVDLQLDAAFRRLPFPLEGPVGSVPGGSGGDDAARDHWGQGSWAGGHPLLADDGSDPELADLSKDLGHRPGVPRAESVSEVSQAFMRMPKPDPKPKLRGSDLGDIGRTSRAPRVRGVSPESIQAAIDRPEVAKIKAEREAVEATRTLASAAGTIPDPAEAPASEEQSAVGELLARAEALPEGSLEKDLAEMLESLQLEVQKLRSKVIRRNSELRAHRSTRAELEAQVETLTSTSEGFEQRVESLERTLEARTQARLDAEEALAQARTQADEARSQAERLRLEAERLRSEAEQRSLSVTSEGPKVREALELARKALAERTERIQVLRDEVTRLRGVVEGEGATDDPHGDGGVAALRAELDESNARREALEAELDEARQAAELEQRMRAGLADELQQATNARAAAEQALAAGDAGAVARLAELEAGLVAANAAVETARGEADAANAKLEAMQADEAGLQARVNELQATAEELQARVDASELAARTAEAEAEAGRAALGERHAELEATKAELDASRQQTDEALADARAVTERLVSAEGEIQAAEAARAQAEARAEAAEAAQAQAEARAEAAEAAQAQAEARAEAAEAAHAEAEARAEAAEAAQAQAEARAETAEAAHAEAVSRAETAEAARAEAEARAETAEAAHAQAEARAETAEAAQAQAEARAETAEAARAEAVSRAAELETKARELEQSVEERDREHLEALAGLQSRLEDRESEVQALEATRTELSERAAQAAAEMAELRASRDAEARRVDALAAEGGVRDARIQELEAELRLRGARIAEVEDEAAAAKAQVEQADARADEAATALAGVEARAAEAEATLADLASAQDAAEGQRAALEAAKAAGEARVTELEAQLEASGRRLTELELALDTLESAAHGQDTEVHSATQAGAEEQRQKLADLEAAVAMAVEDKGKQAAEFERRIAQLQAEIEAAGGDDDGSMQALEAALDAERRRAEESEQARVELAADLEKIQQATVSALTKARDARSSLQAQVVDLESRLAEAEEAREAAARMVVSSGMDTGTWDAATRPAGPADGAGLHVPDEAVRAAVTNLNRARTDLNAAMHGDLEQWQTLEKRVGLGVSKLLRVITRLPQQREDAQELHEVLADLQGLMTSSRALVRHGQEFAERASREIDALGDAASAGAGLVSSSSVQTATASNFDADQMQANGTPQGAGVETLEWAELPPVDGAPDTQAFEPRELAGQETMGYVPPEMRGATSGGTEVGEDSESFGF